MSIIKEETFLEKLQESFNTNENKIFVKSFITYLEYGNAQDKHVIDFDLVWPWVGYKLFSPHYEFMFPNS